MRAHALLPVLALAASTYAQQATPRTPDGKPDFQGIWKAASTAAYNLEDHAARYRMPAGKSVVEGGTIPYLAAAAAKRDENFANRAAADPLNKCYLPGVPRIMYMEYPFQIFQTPGHVAILFEWSSVYRMIYTDGKPPKYEGVESWMGDSRARWDGDTLVVEVLGQNGNTWFDMAGNHHSGAMKVTERLTLLNADTIQYEATMEDPETFSRPWKIVLPLIRQRHMDRVLEYECEAEYEESTGDLFEREPRTWFPEPGAPPSTVTPTAKMPPSGALPEIKPSANIQRQADGKPSISGYFTANSGGANWGLEAHERDFLLPQTRGVIVDPPDLKLPYQPWARQEVMARQSPHRGYDDPTAHCFVAGVPRSVYTPSPFYILQPPGYVLILMERMSWRIVPLDGRKHLPDSIRLWQGDSVGHWDGDTLVIETTNLNGKSWLNEYGDIISHAATVVERFTPQDAGRLLYRATVTDPIVYTAPWTIQMTMNPSNEELLEVACHEDNGDLHNLKEIRDQYRAEQKKEN